MATHTDILPILPITTGVRKGSLLKTVNIFYLGLPRHCGGKESTCQCRRCGFHPWVGKVP